jgi:hypothetical protein
MRELKVAAAGPSEVDMRIPRCALLAAVLAVPTVAAAGDIILPTFAVNFPGQGRNRWSTEIYFSNPTGRTLQASVGAVYLGKRLGDHMCYPPQPNPLEIPAYSSTFVPAREMWRELGCPDAILGGLLLNSDGPLVVSSRMVNAPVLSLQAVLLAGVSQEIPGIPREQLPTSGATYMLPTIGWPSVACGSPAFENYLRAVNPGTEPVTLTIQLDAAGSAATINVGGHNVPVPYSVTVAPESWQQLRIGPPSPPPAGAPCLPDGLRDLFFTVSAPTAVLLSVVDRSTQDPRTVLPIKLEP